jgi:hypothetical protein
MGRATSEEVAFLLNVWPDTEWIRAGDELIWVPARPISNEVEQELLEEFHAERTRNAPTPLSG